MSITANTKIEILNTPKAIWDYANDPENWTASNPKEHMGLTFFNESNRPIEKTRFHQRETVAGVFADLKGYISYVNYPHVLVWNGIAQYKLFRGLIRVSVAEGGLLRLEERGESTHFPMMSTCSLLTPYGVRFGIGSLQKSSMQKKPFMTIPIGN